VIKIASPQASEFRIAAILIHPNPSAQLHPRADRLTVSTWQQISIQLGDCARKPHAQGPQP
jgi:hypothetical protein